MSFHETTITLKVLSEEPIPEDYTLDDILQESDTGAFVAHELTRREVRLSGQEMARALAAAGSEPGFFMLNDHGEREA